MKRIALIHTVRSVLDSFEALLRAALPEPVLVHNILDDFLATDAAEKGVFTETNVARLAADLKNAELTGADFIIVTCSTLTPAVTKLREVVKVPVLAIDDELCRRAVDHGKRILVMATAASTVEPTTSKIRAEAEAAGKTVTIETLLVVEALVALKGGDPGTHDRLLAEAAAAVRDADVIVLAQASMARAEGLVAAASKLPVLSSPALCVADAARTLAELKKGDE